jgi:hypothetical protein
MGRERMQDRGVPAAVGATRKSSRDENTRQTMPHNPNRADCLPAAVGATGRTSKQINDQTGHAENHRRGESFVARGAKAMEQVQGSTGGATRPQEKDVLGCRDWKAPYSKGSIGYARSND